MSVAKLLRALPAFFCALLLPAVASATCESLLPTAVKAAGPGRPITAGDLARIRDIGQPGGSGHFADPPFSISPDGTRAAFVLNQADPATNSYCRALVVLNLAGDAAPRILDRGGDYMVIRQTMRGLFTPTGFIQLVVPQWSPDGKTLAYLKRASGVTQAWRVGADGKDTRQLTRSDVDIEDVSWSADGRNLLLTSRPDLLGANQAIDREGLQGFLYDGRFGPRQGGRPMIDTTDIRTEYTAVGIAGGAPRPATEAEQKQLGPVYDPGKPVRSSQMTRARDGRRAWLEPADELVMTKPRLWVADAAGNKVTCAEATCLGGIGGLWWSADQREVRFLRREGWGGGQSALYRWSGDATAPQRVLLTDDVLQGCQPAGDRLLCAHESSNQPRRLVLVDPQTGTQRVVFDPNPEFAGLRFGKVERLQWKNENGFEGWGDLVLPPDYVPGAKLLPMVVTNYHSDGFLRGSTGDEYPVHVFAAEGFAVLSVERVQTFAGTLPDIRTYDDLNRENGIGWRERRSLLSSLVAGVRQAIDRGIADPARIGITGLSDGSTTARFALINTDLFSAASISSCCVEPGPGTLVYGGMRFAEQLRQADYGTSTKMDPERARPMSMVLNAERLRAPLLMQLSDDEYLGGLAPYTALRDFGQPTEMFVYPNEHHYKWQPAHRLAVYQRNVDWFNFWLQKREDPAPGKAAQYVRWRKLQAEAAAGDTSQKR